MPLLVITVNSGALSLSGCNLTELKLKICFSFSNSFAVLKSPTGHAASLAEAKSFLKTSLPHIVILDIMLGEENGLDFLDALKDYCRTNSILPPQWY